VPLPYLKRRVCGPHGRRFSRRNSGGTEGATLDLHPHIERNQQPCPLRYTPMNFECELDNGQHLEIGNEGDQTFVSFSSRGEGQQQSQGNGFTTGAWSRQPSVYRLEAEYVVRVETTNGARFLRVQGNRTSLLDGEPQMTGAREIELRESAARRMPPMKPMKPMEPMRPMEPMKPMRSMR
jgi:hypothetical protein